MHLAAWFNWKSCLLRFVEFLAKTDSINRIRCSGQGQLHMFWDRGGARSCLIFEQGEEHVEQMMLMVFLNFVCNGWMVLSAGWVWCGTLER